MKYRMVLGILLLAAAAAPVIEYLFFIRGREPYQSDPQFVPVWLIVSPCSAVVGLALIFWTVLRKRFDKSRD